MAESDSPKQPEALTTDNGELRARDLTKRYRGRTVVDGVELSIGRGEVVGLLGPNGAGKTTTFYLILGLVRADGGRIFLGGEEITELPMYLRARRGISYLPQEPSIFRKLTVEENILAILETLPISREEMLERLPEIYTRFILAVDSPAAAAGRSDARHA